MERGEITVTRITSKEMPADILTKRGVNSNVIRKHLYKVIMINSF